MGDRCYLEMRIMSKDLSKVEELCGNPLDGENEEEGIITIRIDETNYGMEDELQEMVKEGITFEGFHGSGGSYGPCVFAGDNKEFAIVSCSHEGAPMVGVSDEGVPYPEDLEKVKRYLTLHKIVEYKLDQCSVVKEKKKRR